ncbi:MAG TPA: hypothetical protein VM118_14185 [Acidobacteriota bacterium]|nr:hypothetical protein [Acidobacteriota bacterium]
MRQAAIVLGLAVGIGLAGARAEAQPVLGGFVEAVQAIRVEENAVWGDGDLGARLYPRSELRAQLTARESRDREELFVRVDIVSDATGRVATDVDLREAYIKVRLFDWLDIKAGRQVATWGTGDLIFANDLFAKDWQAFLTALDDAYLKPPQDLLRASLYSHGLTLEVALSPYFTPDNLPRGERISVYNPFTGYAVGSDGLPRIVEPSHQLENGEFFARIAGWRGSAEWALYGYNGFWPTPQGATESGILYYPRMWSGGASLRLPLGSVLAHSEIAAYISRDDTDGDNPFVANSQIRGLVGAEKSLGNDWTVGAQYYAEWMMNHDRYVTSLAGFPEGTPVFDEVRSTVTGRIGKWARQQTLYISLFGYWGITDEDWHLRPAVSYKVTDAVQWTVGGSLVGGENPYTTFGQFRDNSNIFTRVRFSF